jgi:hypothetical protein
LKIHIKNYIFKKIFLTSHIKTIQKQIKINLKLKNSEIFKNRIELKYQTISKSIKIQTKPFCCYIKAKAIISYFGLGLLASLLELTIQSPLLREIGLIRFFFQKKLVY